VKQLSLIVAILLTSCSQNVRNSIEKQLHEVDTQYLNLRKQATGLKGQSLSWSQALANLEDNNLELKSAALQLHQSREVKKQIYWDLVPTVQLSSAVSKAVQELGDINDQDLSWGISSFINIPGALGFKANVYSAELSIARDEVNYLLKKRELTNRLRETFIEYHNYELRYSRLKNQRLLQQGSKDLEQVLAATPEDLEEEKEWLQIKTARWNLNKRISKLLGDYSSQWKLEFETIPKLNYVKKPLPTKDIQSFAYLYRKQMAMSLEAMRLVEIGIKARFFPDIRMGLSTPPLIRYDRGTQSEFSAESVIWRLTTSVTLDTNFRNLRNLRNTKERNKLQKETLKEQLLDQIVELDLAERELKLLYQERELLQKRLRLVESLPSPKSIEERRLNQRRKLLLYQQEGTLIQQIARIEGGFWILDDQQWDDQLPKKR